MRILLTGACGFVGSCLARCIAEAALGWDIVGFDNLGRPGSEVNRATLRHLGIRLIHGDLRCQSDVDALPDADWIIDCAAQPSVLAGIDGRSNSRQLMEHNLIGTIHMLELCRARKMGLILLRTSWVYSMELLAKLSVEVHERAFCPDPRSPWPSHLSLEGITEEFSTAAPVSLYGATKLASETLALEYGTTYDLPVWINRCGVLAGAGQFGRPDQGIFAFWINSHLRRAPLRYIGYDGAGHQVRDCLHPRDLLALLLKQTAAAREPMKPRLVNVAGGAASAMSLRQLTDWCDDRFGVHPVGSDLRPRPFDLPWVVLDAHGARAAWDWTPRTPVRDILEEIARHAEANPNWLEISTPV